MWVRGARRDTAEGRGSRSWRGLEAEVLSGTLLPQTPGARGLPGWAVTVSLTFRSSDLGCDVRGVWEATPRWS